MNFDIQGMAVFISILGFAQRNTCPFLNYTTRLFCYFAHQPLITHALFEQITTSEDMRRESEVLS